MVPQAGTLVYLSRSFLISAVGVANKAPLAGRIKLQIAIQAWRGQTRVAPGDAAALQLAARSLRRAFGHYNEGDRVITADLESPEWTDALASIKPERITSTLPQSLPPQEQKVLQVEPVQFGPSVFGLAEDALDHAGGVWLVVAEDQLIDVCHPPLLPPDMKQSRPQRPLSAERSC